SLPALLQDQPELEGFNITIPHKEGVIPFLFEKSKVVEEINACNCIRVKNRLLYGHNTDVVGFEKSLRNFIPNTPNGALILGTGGSARAVAFVLKKLNISFSFVSRKASPSQYSYSNLTKGIIEQHQLIINTTPLGMYPADQFPDIPYSYVGSKHFLFDLLYNPNMTIFMKKGAERGAKVKNGYEMLELQADESWRIWNA
ncbi:MAG TPA: shikimate dehydrogenase, partial [Acidobacteriota bacterium]